MLEQLEQLKAGNMFSLVVFVLIFAGLFTVSYTFTYNHNLIPSYLSPGRIAKSNINQYKNEIEYLYKVSLIALKIDPDEEDQAGSNHLGHNAESINSAANKLYNTIVKIIFSCGVSASGMLVILILCELIELFDSGARLFFFHTVINLLILLLTVVQPYVVISLVVFQKISPSQLSAKLGLLVFFTLYMAWFYALNKFGALSSEFIPESALNEGILLLSSKTLIERKINEVSIAGITIMAVLSGVGSMSTPYRQLPQVYKKYAKGLASSLRRKSKVTQQELNNLIQSFNNTQSLIDKRKFQLGRLLEKNSETIHNGNNLNYSMGTSNSTIVNGDNSVHSLHSLNQLKLGGLFNKVQSFASLSSLANLASRKDSEETELLNEIESLKTLKTHIYDDFLKRLDKFKVEQDESRNKSVVKLLLSWFDWGFGLYCIYRIFNVIFIKLPYQAYYSGTRDSSAEDGIGASNDALAITIAKLVLSFHSLPITESQLVYQVSFLLSGGLFLCSITNVLTTLRSFKKFVPSVGKYTTLSMTWLKHLLILELLGIYVMSTALLIRTNLPENLSNQVSKILSLTGTSSSSTPKHTAVQEVAFIDSWFDRVFAITCVVTLILLILRNYLDEDDRDDEFDEESMIETGKFV